MSVSKLSGLIIIFVAGFIGYRMYQERPEQIAETETPEQAVAIEREAPPEQLNVVANPEPKTTVIVEPDSADEPGCLTLSQFRQHPLLRQDADQLAAISSSGPDIQAYRGIELQAVNDFALQGDSAAMAVMGAAAVLRALGKDEADAVAMLQSESAYAEQSLSTHQFSPDAMLALNDAAYWYYQSALRGRVNALSNYGELRSVVFGGPVGLGWISQEDYAVLDEQDQLALDPVNVYASLADDIAPQLDQLLNFESPADATINELKKSVRSDLRQEFDAALVEAELPPVYVDEGALQRGRELLDRVCASARP